MNALERVISIIGSQTRLAEKLNTTPQAVQQWVAKGQVPALRVISIETAVVGKVSRHELRPDLYPKESLPQTT
ncbi:transcriptional regulator [Neptunomonas japonica]|uniref:Cro/Cl family transcriptional regulator n=1 Tax=Neptunomonas japonica JAMM 1380 TaxID=1441457 RepID=A0A7R6SW39_9GAMM|nr:Cro/CI family transcriptional regulator [Neptunomonas japonica]BBB29355.1 Cro/Cl family transcriptional regulator [Neptunomonas japonica JAMM 1380]